MRSTQSPTRACKFTMQMHSVSPLDESVRGRNACLTVLNWGAVPLGWKSKHTIISRITSHSSVHSFGTTIGVISNALRLPDVVPATSITRGCRIRIRLFARLFSKATSLRSTPSSRAALQPVWSEMATTPRPPAPGFFVISSATSDKNSTGDQATPGQQDQDSRRPAPPATRRADDLCTHTLSFAWYIVLCSRPLALAACRDPGVRRGSSPVSDSVAGWLYMSEESSIGFLRRP